VLLSGRSQLLLATFCRRGIAEEIVQHLVALRGAHVEVTLDIAAHMPEGAPEHVVRTVTENGRTLKFTSQGFEDE
jgi:hypothetical protein